MTDLSPGTALGSYTILQYIGAGGMGDVYLARHEKLRRHVAIKVLPPDLEQDRKGLARFEREAQTASSLNHPNIVTIHDIGEHEGTTYIAMELVEGRTVRDLLKEGRLPIDRIVEIAIQIADGMSEAHAAGIVHRDLKPPNVMVTDSGLVKILDFGLAKPLRGSVRGALYATLTQPGEGLVAGTPHYMSPEQLSGNPIDHRSDHFAFGVLLYEMACGEPPFGGPSPGAVMSAVLTRPAAPIRRCRPDTPAALEGLISRCLEKDPDDRYDRTEELGSELRALRDRRRGSSSEQAAQRSP